MDDKKTFWDSVSLNSIKFEVDDVHKVIFSDDFTIPDEDSWEDGSQYCVFEVTENGEEKVIRSSAMGLLSGLKELEPLAGKTVVITKRLINGKQRFLVTDFNGPGSSEKNVTVTPKETS